MRGAAAVMCVAAAMISTTLSAAQQVDELQLTVCITDYANLDAGAIGRTQRLVGEIYRAVGVRTAWAATRHPADEADRTTGSRDGDEDVTIMILSANMGDRKRLPKDALGSAAIGAAGRGRIAYVLHDRVAAAAMASDRAVVDILSLVIAHEVGHLLLPSGSHSPDGLMRAHWNVDDLRRRHPQLLSFTPGQAELIRDMLAVGNAVSAAAH